MSGESSNDLDNAITCTEPNRHARPVSIELTDDAVLFRGYQEFTLTKTAIAPSNQDKPLQEKRNLLSPFFTPRYLQGRKVLDLGANAGFYSYWALQNGADESTCLDIDRAYLDVIRNASSHLGLKNLRIAENNVSDWDEPADVVLALALVHWMYSCTSVYGSLSSVVEKLASLTRYVLIVEWVSSTDPAIEFFGHLDWNSQHIKEPYTLEAFESALGRCFARFELVGEVSPTRRIYAAFQTTNEIDLSGPLPLILDKEKIVSSRLLTTDSTIQYWSRVYCDSSSNLVMKQATLDLAEHEYSMLSQFESDYFPRAVDLRSEDGFSVLTLEKIDGIPLAEEIPQIVADPSYVLSFLFDCLNILRVLKGKGVQHRDIKPDNILIRNRKPVLTDFGWAVSEKYPYLCPPGLGREYRPQDGMFCDVYSIGRVFSDVNQHRFAGLDLVIDLMTEEDAAWRLTDPGLLEGLLATVVSREFAGFTANEDACNSDRFSDRELPGLLADRLPDAIPFLLFQLSRRNRQLRFLKTERKDFVVRHDEKCRQYEVEVEQRNRNEAVLQEKDRQIEKVQSELAEVQSDRDRVETILDERNRQLKSFEYRVVELDKHIAETERAQQSRLQEKTEEIVSLNMEIAKSRAQAGSLQLNLDRAISDLRSLQSTRTVRFSRAAGMNLGRLKETFKGPIQGSVDILGQESVFTGSVIVGGWAFSKAAPIARVEILLSDTKAVLGTVNYGLERLDVAGARPWQGETNCGYSGIVSVRDIPLDQRSYVVRVTDAKGNSREFVPPIKDGQTVLNTNHLENLYSNPDSRGIDRPLVDIEIAVWNGSRLEVEGWALWASKSSNGFARLNLNGVMVGETQVNLSRPDIGPRFQGNLLAYRCGFRFFSTLPVFQPNPNGPNLLTVEFCNEGFRPFSVSTSVALALNSTKAESAALGENLNAFLEEVQVKLGRPPYVLDWNTGLELLKIYPQFVVFSPPLTDSVLPYIDKSIDVVVLQNDTQLVGEARRVAEMAVVLIDIEGAPQNGVEVVSPGISVEWLLNRKTESALRASIIIPVHNNAAYTDSCLSALDSTLPCDFNGEIIIVDDASTDETPGMLEEWSRKKNWIKVVKNTQNLGFIDSCNLGAQIADGDVVVFLNNDTIPRPGWLSALLRTLADLPDAGAVGGKLLFPDGTLQEAGGVIFLDGTGANFGKWEKTPDAPLFSFLREVDYCSGAVLATRRTLFEEIGGFDTRFRPAYFEDADYCFTVRKKGYKVYYQPECEVVHFEGATSGTDLTSGAKQYQVANRAKFVAKWHSLLKNHPNPPSEYDSATWNALSLRDWAQEGENNGD